MMRKWYDSNRDVLIKKLPRKWGGWSGFDLLDEEKLKECGFFPVSVVKPICPPGQILVFDRFDRDLMVEYWKCDDPPEPEPDKCGIFWALVQEMDMEAFENFLVREKILNPEKSAGPLIDGSSDVFLDGSSGSLTGELR